MTDERLEIWFLIGMLPVGGTERTLLELTDGLNREEFSVTVWTIADEGELIDHLAADVEYRTLGAAGKWDFRAPMRFFAAAASERPDVINSFLFFDNVLARIAGRLVGETVVTTGVREVPNDPPRIRSFLDKLTQGWSDEIVSNSQAGTEYVVERGAPRENVRTIRNGRDVPRYASGTATEELYRALSLDEDDVIVGTVGRLVERKGHYDLLEAWSTVVNAHPDARLLFVGNGPERAGLEASARELDCADSVRFAGQRDDVPDLLDAMDVFVFPSHYEGLSGALIEAMIAGLPTVATPVDGNSELIEDEVTGLFIPPYDSEALAERLIELLGDAELREKLGTAASDYAREEFAIETMVSEFEALYREVT